MIEVRGEKGGVVFAVHVRPGASRNRAGGEHGGALKVAVTAPPEGGRANRAVVEVVAEALGVRRSRVSITAGLKDRRKTVRVEGMGRAEAVRALSALGG